MTAMALDEELLVYALVTLGLVASIWAAVTQKGSAQQQRQQRLEQRLARHPDAVLIKRQPRRALWRVLPLVMLGAAVLLGSTYVKRHGVTWLCERYGVEVAANLMLHLVCHGIPGFVALLLAAHAFKSLRVLRSGYSPPLDSVVMHDTVAVTGWRAKVNGLLGLLLMPLLAGGVLYLGHSLYLEWPRDATPPPLAAQCPSPAGPQAP